MRFWTFAWLAAFFSLIPQGAESCTTFAQGNQDQLAIGKSYDWNQPHGRVLLNPKNLKKSSLVLRAGDRSIEWTSRFGSLTFNQHGQDLPLGGMNEAGLVVEIMWLDSTVYPAQDKRPAFSELQWIQYQLDNFSKTSEVVARAPQIRVSSILAKVHYLVCDRSGECATFEYVGGKLVVHSKLKVRTLTNSTYADSLSSLKKYQGFGGTLPLPKGAHSLSRFARAAHRSANFSGTDLNAARTFAFGTLDSVKAVHTRFQIVYTPGPLRVDFRTDAHSALRHISLKDLSWSCLDGVRWLDSHAPLSGDLKQKFMAFEPQDNLDLVRSGMKGFENQLPPGILQAVAKFPQTFRCQE